MFTVLEQENCQDLSKKHSLLTSRWSSKGNAVYTRVVGVGNSLTSTLMLACRSFLSGCGFNHSLQSQMTGSSL